MFTRVTCIITCLMLALFSVKSVRAQQQTTSDDLLFIDYLISNREFNDALLLLRHIKLKGDLTSQQQDSLNYLLGWTFYNTKQLDSSITYFSRVDTAAAVFTKAAYYRTFCLLYTERYREAEQSIPTLPAADSVMLELRQFQQATGFLLQKKYALFDSTAQLFKFTNFACAAEQKNLFTYRDELKKIKKRSPVLAGVFSAVIPGSGKLYAGYKGQALASLIPCVVFGAVAAENLIKDGPRDAKFIAAASIFSIFYVGNIWGSVMSVKTIQTQKNDEIYNTILLDLHIPLRRVFN